MAEYNSFSFNGTRCSTFGLLITQPPKISVPKRRMSRESVPGRNGTLLIDDGGFEDVSASYTVNAKLEKDRVEYSLRGVKAWLSASFGIHQLADSYDPLYFRYASYDGGADFENIFNGGMKGTMSFTCQPMKMSWAGQNTAKLLATGTIYNPEAFESRPYIKVYGTGAGNLFINNATIQFTNIDGYTEVDSDLGQAFKAETGKNNTVILENWPIFQPGENFIQWDGKISYIEYIPRWCTL